MFTHSRRTAGLLASVLFAVLLIGACSMDPTALSEEARSAAAAAAERCYTCEDDPPTPPSSYLGSASGFVILGGPAVTITNSMVTGDVGTGFPGAPVTVTLPSVVDGTVHQGDAISQAAYNDFLLAYIALSPVPGVVPAGATLIVAAPPVSMTLPPGVYYSVAGVTFTNVVLTLDAQNDPNAQWTFLIGTGDPLTGALTGTDFTVELANGAEACNVTWWVAEAVTMTTSSFQGSILAGAGITFTGPGSLVGRAFAKAAVTLTDMDPFDLCVGADPGKPGKPGKYGDRVTGGGWIELPSRQKGTFAVSAGIKNGVLRGQLEYSVHSYRGRWGHSSTSFKVKGTGITQYLVVDATRRHIEGTAKVNGVGGFTYKVDVTDNGEGRKGRQQDYFAIWVYDGSGGLVYSASGALAGGNIQLHDARGGWWGWRRD